MAGAALRHDWDTFRSIRGGVEPRRSLKPGHFGRGRRLCAAGILAFAVLAVGCSTAGPLTSTLRLDGDEPFLPQVAGFQPAKLSTAPEGLPLRPGDVLFLSQQTFAPAGTSVGPKFGRRAPSDLGVLRLPLRRIGVPGGPACHAPDDAQSALSPSERLVLSTLLGNVRQKYSHAALDYVEGNDVNRGLDWQEVDGPFKNVLERCEDGLWNAFVDSLRAHRLAGSNERLLISVDLKGLASMLPDDWSQTVNDNPNDLKPRDVFGYLFITGYKHGKEPNNTRVELSTLSGAAFTSFEHVLYESGNQLTYGKAFTPENHFRPRFTPRHWVVLNGVDFRSIDLDRDEMHWTLEQVENAMICVGRDKAGAPMPTTITALRHGPFRASITLFNDRNGAATPQICDISVGLQSVPDNAATIRGKAYLGSRYFDYPLEPPPIVPTEHFGNPGVCGPTWIWRVNTGPVAHASRVLDHIPVHSVSELTWDGALTSTDQRPSVSERCLVN